jgi:predicted nucleic acid-binding protein
LLFDTDIFIWVQRDSIKAARLVESVDERHLSAQTYMELFQGAQYKQQHHYVKEFLTNFNFHIIQFSENIGHRACIYIEEYALSTGLRADDAIVGATATENNLTLVTSNARRFKSIKDLRLKVFKP